MGVGEPRVLKAATALLGTINSLTERLRDKCEPLQLAEIYSAVR